LRKDVVVEDVSEDSPKYLLLPFIVVVILFVAIMQLVSMENKLAQGVGMMG
jgi:hypothetical protein